MILPIGQHAGGKSQPVGEVEHRRNLGNVKDGLIRKTQGSIGVSRRFSLLLDPEDQISRRAAP
jgi:hypothetical protein